jgi:hypothetical protein
MPTSPLYDSTHQYLTTHLTEALESQIETLALVVVAISHSVSAQIGKIARAMPLDTTQAAKEQRIRRLLDNERLTQAEHYQPLAKAALHGLKGQRVQLLIDRVLLRNIHNILVVSIGFRRRSLPLAWIALDHRGQSGLADQQAVLGQALALLPSRVRVSIHGDSELRSQELFAWVRAQGHDGMLGLPGRTLVALTPDGAATALATWLPNRDSVAYLNGVYLTEDRQGPVNILAWWAKDDEGKPIVHAVMTNLPANWQTYRRGSHRMWIEIVFSQVTKADVRTGFGRWDDIANFDLVVRHDHTIDQEFDQLPALSKGRLCQSLLKAFTECLGRGDGCARLVKLLTHMRQLPRLGLQVVALLDQLALPPLEFGSSIASAR